MARIWHALAGLGDRPRLSLFLILGLGFALRAVQTHLGLPYIYNFDDPQIAGTALNVMKSGDWNPHFFAYGSLTIYIDVIVDTVNYIRLAQLPEGSREGLFGVDQLKLIDTIAVWKEGSPIWYWSISHPSFYLWDRYVTALFGVGTIAATAAIARRIIPGAMALVPPLLLAVTTIHIVHSGLTTTDIPVGFMVGVATLAAMVFAETGGLTAFMTSLIFVGFAAATKYNSGLILISPLLALLIRSGEEDSAIRWWHWLLLALVPAAAFLTAMPFALLDFRRFITDLAQSAASYHGPGPREAHPGIRHIRLILTQFSDNLGFFAALLALAGAGLMAATATARRSLILILAFPLAFMLYMSTTTADHHRNFMQLYPFLALYAGYGLYRLAQWPIGAGTKATSARALAVLAILATAVLPLLYRSVANATNIIHSRDSRSVAVEKAKAIGVNGPFEISGQLHIHAFDLDVLGPGRNEVDQDQIAEDICSATDGRIFILPAEMRYTNFYPATPTQAEAIVRFNGLMRSLKGRGDTIAIGSSLTPTWGPLNNPEILILRARPGLCDKPQL
jgi:hypothetical protein